MLNMGVQATFEQIRTFFVATLGSNRNAVVYREHKSMASRVRFVCPSETCGKQIEIPGAQKSERKGNPKCVCGSEMKKVYEKPTVRKLSSAEVENLKNVFRPDKSSDTSDTD